MRPGNFFIILAPWVFIHCENNNTPLDAESRQRIDSTVIVTNKATETEIDSLCKISLTTDLNRLADSMKSVRKKEIKSTLNNLPKEAQPQQLNSPK
jgi:hypothetical protein